MYDIKKQHLNSIFALWTNWLIASGSLILIVFLGLWISALWLPLVTFGIETCLYIYIRRQIDKKYSPCSLSLYIAMRSLFWSGVIMVIINLLYSYRVVHHIFDPELLNNSIPYIPILIIGPVTAANAILAKVKGTKLIFCQLCQQRNGMPHERGFLGKTFMQEGYYQNTLLINLFALLTCVTWPYYFLKYINVNLNSVDTFMFFWLPVILWIVAGLHIGIRYAAFWNYYDQNLSGSAQQIGRYTRLRLILINNDRIFVRVPDKDFPDLIPEERKIDTPCHLQIRYNNDVSVDYALRSFSNMIQVGPIDLRFLYSNLQGNPDFNIFHYVAYLNDEQSKLIDIRYPNGEWLTMKDIETLLNGGELNPFLSAEIIRIYTIAMAWKIYDEKGMRRYKIKHYRPSFRLEDMKNWDVDYNDPNWLFVAFNNADVPFWRIRRFWYHHIAGIHT